MISAGQIIAAKTEDGGVDELRAFLERFGRARRPLELPRSTGPAAAPNSSRPRPYEPEEWQHVRTPYGDKD